VFASDLHERLRRRPEFDQAKAYAESMGLPFNPMVAPPGGGHRATAALARLADAAHDHSCCEPAETPEIDSFETYDDDLKCCSVEKGKKITGAAPGTYVRIRGRGFAADRAANVV